MTRETGLRQRNVFRPKCAENLSLADKALASRANSAILPGVGEHQQ